jgi:hypothetical protein
MTDNFRFSDFYWQQRKSQEQWREVHISTKEFGTQHHPSEPKERKYRHIVPFQYWQETLWKDIRIDLVNYIDKPSDKIEAHEGVHNLLSSWILCANLYFFSKLNENFRALMLGFLRQKVSEEIIELMDIELEFAFPKGDELHPKQLLGEKHGTRGKNQTSPDMAFIVKTKMGDGIILTECKYTEHHFYPCSTRPDPNNPKPNPNLDFSRCVKPKKGYDYKSICHQTTEWNRKYMDLLEFSPIAENLLLQCPAATDGYQLFRQQALAEGIAKSGKFDLVVSSVAFDGRNTELINCLKSTGVNDFQSEWDPLFNGKTIFKTWMHQEWVQFVRKNQKNDEFSAWLEYVNKRYGY